MWADGNVRGSKRADTIDKVKQLIRSGTPLSDDDRTKLAVASKNAVATRRQALKLIAQAQWKELVSQNTHELVFYKEYKAKVRLRRGAAALGRASSSSHVGRWLGVSMHVSD